jgi:hypothetical protein
MLRNLPVTRKLLTATVRHSPAAGVGTIVLSLPAVPALAAEVDPDRVADTATAAHGLARVAPDRQESPAMFRY